MRTRLLLLALLASLLAAPAALAAPKGPVFGLRAVGNPKLGYFVFPATAGSVLHGAVTVSNSGDRAGTVRMFAADATTGATTGAVYLTDAAPKSVGGWIRLDRGTISLRPNQSARVGFTATVPGGAQPGQYVAGIVAETGARVQGPRSKRKANVQIRVRNLSIVAVQVNIPGPLVPRFAIGRVAPGGQKGFQQLLVHVGNSGNVLRKPKGTVTVLDSAGQVTQTIPFTMDTFLPHTEIDYPVTLKKALGAGDYTARVRLTYPGGAPVSASPRFSVSKQNVQQVFTSSKPTAAPPGGVGSNSGGGTPAWIWPLVAIGAALLLGGAGFARWRRRAAPVAPAPDRDPCVPHHYWQVDYDRFVEGPGGRRFLHRCRDCGLEVMADSVSDASAQAEALRPKS